MSALLLALFASAAYGCSDFVGGLASRRAGALRAVVHAQLAGAVLMAAVLPWAGGAGFAPAAFGWGAASGLAGGIGVALLYRGLARGAMAVVAPITAVEAAALPVIVGLAAGERPGALALAGVAIALAAVVLVSAAPQPPPGADDVIGAPAAPGMPAAADEPALWGARAHAAPGSSRWPPGVPEAVGAGIAFAAFFVLLAPAGTEAGIWPLIGARVVSSTLLLAGAAALRRSVRPVPGTRRLVVTAGALDFVANAAFLVAVTTGLISLVAVVTSLYPASTVVLARVLLGERLSRPQVLGLGLAVAGVVLIGLP
jgi:drug/metabolite transporter (DMT)-like permease